jgi:hypothetical protein
MKYLRLIASLAGFLTSTILIAQVGLGTYNAANDSWECQDDCLVEKDDLLCGNTDHFLIANNGGDGSQTTTISVDFDVTFQNTSGQMVPNGDGNSTTVSVSVLGAQEALFTNTVESTGMLEITQEVITNTGGLVVTGNFSGTLTAAGGFEANAEGGSDAFLLMYDEAGNLQFGTVVGGPQEDAAQAVTIDEDGSVYLGGLFSITEFNNQVEGGPLADQVQPGAPMDIVLKFSNEGQQLWATAVGQFQNFQLKAMEAGNDGSVLIGAETEPVTNENPLFEGIDGPAQNVLSGKLGPDGNLSWIGMTQSAADMELNAMHLNGDGSFYLGGSFEGQVDFDLSPEEQVHDSNIGADFFMVKYSANGQMIHPHIIDWGNGDDAAESITEMNDGTLLVNYASALSPELDLICSDPGANCTGEQKIGFLSVLPGEIESERIFIPTWSTQATKSAQQECKLASGNDDTVYTTCTCSHLSVNTPTGPLLIENTPATVVFQFEVQTKGCTNPDACNFDPNASLEDGTCIFDGNCTECGGNGGNCIGCTDPDACNFAPNAFISTECFYPNGCTDELALNYKPDANCDDGSCVYAEELCGECTVWDPELGTCVEDPACAEGCIGDVNNDGAIGSADLLTFLSVFGTTCEN